MCSPPSYCDGRTISFTRFLTLVIDEIPTGLEYKTLKTEFNLGKIIGSLKRWAGRFN
ncbi:MAG: hypothetical protein VST67_15275 [Nitrospirota bacterium]|nr:hypothetical protein [Nitrospirota bacterium]